MALNLEQIRRTADRVAASHGLDVVEIDYLGSSRQRVLRIFIEKNREERAKLASQESGATAEKDPGGEEGALFDRLESEGIALDQLAWVTHQDCESFSKDFGTVLDVEDLVPGADYTLEVSSPGLDRKLTAPADYERFRGSKVKVQTFAPVAGNRHWQGRVTEVKVKGIVLDVTAIRQKGKKKGPPAEQTVEIPFAEIEKANLVPEVGA